MADTIARVIALSNSGGSGAIGATGVTGVTGVTGPQGPQGPTGPAPQGQAVWYTYNSTTNTLDLYDHNPA